MKNSSSLTDLEVRAIEALRAVLGQVSVIKLSKIERNKIGRSKVDRNVHGSSADCTLVAHIDVLGRSHTLACPVLSATQPGALRTALGRGRRSESETRVIIAPYLSPEEQALCKESQTAFLDLEGNSRIVLGEVFIGSRSLSRTAPRRFAELAIEDTDRTQSSDRRVYADKLRSIDRLPASDRVRFGDRRKPFPPRAVDRIADRISDRTAAPTGVAAIPA